MSSEPRSLTATKSMSAPRCDGGPEEVAADAAEAVDADTNGHEGVVLSPANCPADPSRRPRSDSEPLRPRWRDQTPENSSAADAVDRSQLAGGRRVALAVLVVPDDEPADGAARSIAGLVATLAEVAAVPPRVPGLDGEPDVRPGEVEVDRSRRTAARAGTAAPASADRARSMRSDEVELEAALRGPLPRRGLLQPRRPSGGRRSARTGGSRSRYSPASSGVTSRLCHTSSAARSKRCWLNCAASPNSIRSGVATRSPSAPVATSRSLVDPARPHEPAPTAAARAGGAR